MANAGTEASGIVVTFDGKTVGELVGVSHDGFTVTVVDISSSADSSNWKDFLPGKKDPGVLELKLRGHSATAVTSGDQSPLFWIGLGKDDLVIKFPLAPGQSVAAQIAIKAFCMGDGVPMGEQDNPTERTLKFKLCGLPTFTAAS